MEIEDFGEVISTIAVAKALYDIGRRDILQTQFFDVLDYDAYYENMLGTISSVFLGFYNDYSDDDETELMIFTDDIIGQYFSLAYEYGRVHKIPHAENPFVVDAENEVQKWFDFSYSLGWKLLGYTKSKSAVPKSKLVIRTAAMDFCEYDHLAYGLIKLYQFFADKCAEVSERTEVTAA